MNQSNQEDGQGLVEYALVLVLVAVVIIIILTVLGSSVVRVYASVAGGLQGDVIDDGAVLLTNIAGTPIGGGNCRYQSSDVAFVVTDADGNLITDSAVSATVRVGGASRGSISGSASGSGIASGSINATGPCNSRVTLSAN
jgi:pilus assembly protein Flp/PilA